MKKLQCEVCGSTEIKKVSDGIFECQSCGVQYSSEEVQKMLVEITGEVKLDRSKDIQNTLTRAVQFLEKGDLVKALEYYNKVLDLDPHNEAAQQAIRSIEEKKNAKQQQAQCAAEAILSTVNILEHTVKPEDGIACFLKALKKAPDVAPDIFKEIEILSVTQGYYPFAAVGKKYSGTYRGVACYRKQIPYTDYETKTDYHNKNQDGSYRTTQVAVTKYREEIERKNVSGSFMVDDFGVFSVGKTLSDTFTNLAPDKYDGALSSDCYNDEILNATLQKDYYNDVILQQIETYVTNNYSTLKNALKEVRIGEKKAINSLEVFTEPAVPAWDQRISKTILASAGKKAERTVRNAIPGDFHENASFQLSEKGVNRKTIYLPIQIIEYAYRGKFYLSAMLLAGSNQLIYAYPCTTMLKKVEKTTQKAINTAKNIPFPPFLLTLYGLAIVALIAAFWNGVVKGDAFAGQFWGVLGGICLAPSILWNIIWSTRKKAALNSAIIQNTSTLDSAAEQYRQVLDACSLAFFKVYADPNSIKRAVAAAMAASAFRTDIASIRNRTTYTTVSPGKSSNGGLAQVKNTDDQILSADCKYTIRLVQAGSNISDICKLLRDSCGIGLVAAKELTESPRSVIAQGLSAEAADDLTTKLKLAGATVDVEIEK